MINIDYDTIQADVVAMLQSDPFYENIFIFGAEDANIISQANEALAGKKVINGKAGAALQVGKPFGIDPDPSAPGPKFIIEVRVMIKIVPTINNGAYGTGLKAEQISLHTAQSLQGWAAMGQQSNTFYCPANFDSPLSFGRETGLEGRLVVMHAAIAATPLPRTVTPLISENSPLQVTIGVGAPDASAAVVYTTDGSSPGFSQTNAGNPQGTGALYAGPFNVPTNTIVRAMALAAGKLPSIATSDQIT